MVLVLAGLAGPVWAQDDVAIASETPHPTEPSLATRLKYGLRAGIPNRGSVRIVSVRLYESASRLSIAELDRRLRAPEWLPVGILETRDDGRLRVTCHLEKCVAEAGDIHLNLQLPTTPPPPRPPRPPRP